jgi:hypothetical protein
VDFYHYHLTPHLPLIKSLTWNSETGYQYQVSEFVHLSNHQSHHLFKTSHFPVSFYFVLAQFTLSCSTVDLFFFHGALLDVQLQ